MAGHCSWWYIIGLKLGSTKTHGGCDFDTLGLPRWSQLSIMEGWCLAGHRRLSKKVTNNHLGLHSFVGFPTWKLTWQWKNKNLKMYLQSKMVIFYCHVSFPGSFPPSSDDKMRNPRFSSGPVFPGSKWSFGAMERRCIWAAGGVCQQVFPPRTDRWNMMKCETYKHIWRLWFPL